MQIAIIDYNCGNLFSIFNAFENIGARSKITADAAEIKKADALVLPGVGAFQTAMENLSSSGLKEILIEKVKSGTPIFGICLGMQLLFESSEEFGNCQGLSLIPGKVLPLPDKNKNGEALKIPHIGWNEIYEPSAGKWERSPLSHLKQYEHMYFVHSFYASPLDQKHVLAISNYKGVEYCAAVMHQNIFAVQFHPEKSAARGLGIYKNWLALIK